RRVDVVPPSLAIAQAAEETGWGQARSAHTRNALIGEMTVAANGRVQVRAFDGLEQAVQAYVANLNSHKAYASLRGVRADLRRQAREP
ncbi:glucosaminidase domain-containing protein, partial [Acinetobacter baumannii]